MAATTMTTTVVIPVVTMSSRRSNSIIANVPIPINSAIPASVNEKNQRYSRHNAKLTLVAIKRATPADQLSSRVVRNTNTAATAAHIPPNKSESLLITDIRAWVMIQ